MVDIPLLEEIEKLRRHRVWPRVNLPFFQDPASQARESQRAGILLPVFELAAAESCPVVVELRVGRGLVARMAARAVWDATVVAVGHWCDPHSTAYYDGWRRAAPAAFPLFARDLAECHERVVPLRETPAEATNATRSMAMLGMIRFWAEEATTRSMAEAIQIRFLERPGPTSFKAMMATHLMGMIGFTAAAKMIRSMALAGAIRSMVKPGMITSTAAIPGQTTTGGLEGRAPIRTMKRSIGVIRMNDL